MAKETVAGKAIEDLIKSGSIVRLGDQPKEKLDVLSTGSIGLDKALGIGGLPRGRITEIFGQESSGKSSIALQTVASAQKLGGLAAYIDTEYSLDADYAAALGVDVDNLLVSQPSSAEETMKVVEELVRSNNVSIVVLDSVAAMVTQQELNGEYGDANMGVMPRLMAQFMRKITAAVSESNTCLILINQMRSKLGVVFGSPHTTTGGNSLKFYASVRLEISKIGQIKEGERVIASRTKVKVVKSKVSPPLQTCEFDMIFGEGVSRAGEILDLALAKGIITKKGSWFSYGDKNLGQGTENIRELLKKDADFSAEIEKQLGE